MREDREVVRRFFLGGDLGGMKVASNVSEVDDVKGSYDEIEIRGATDSG